ncbi:MAG: hypothetical protein E2P02_25980 [Acidobacteria bacterium]|nr:MAG: hypothetical protein E2P02_25980 [Acidobacteriota bacterium]
MPSRSNEEASDRSQQSLHHRDISGHPELFVCGARGAEKLAGFFAISGCVSLQKHTPVPAPYLGLLETMGKLLGLRQRCFGSETPLRPSVQRPSRR